MANKQDNHYSQWKNFVNTLDADTISEEQIINGVNIIKAAILAKYPFARFEKEEDEDEIFYYMYVHEHILFTVYQNKSFTVDRDVDIKRGDEGIVSLTNNNKDTYLDKVYELLETYPLLDTVRELYNVLATTKDNADMIFSK
ncbi:Hypothetical protein ORPV_1184 [Orpheovirus IHUMI-LCC2]|uniref:Uncharacterized protein n=1 Tax=Orpheovirus IHUMI-LCC2 TaxID=2023057 RepID=A0A2I2L6B3_9VIRU|nr:Hypothetical protein ORPV_1184 [Orpheovirus IHUMI-LCC2]SNW63088.1 Hypothetical protein ORPV_1184 [Orpheovirus IHUMI-LCC2]